MQCTECYMSNYEGIIAWQYLEQYFNGLREREKSEASIRNRPNKNQKSQNKIMSKNLKRFTGSPISKIFQYLSQRNIDQNKKGTDEILHVYPLRWNVTYSVLCGCSNWYGHSQLWNRKESSILSIVKLCFTWWTLQYFKQTKKKTKPHGTLTKTPNPQNQRPADNNPKHRLLLKAYQTWRSYYKHSVKFYSAGLIASLLQLRAHLFAEGYHQQRANITTKITTWIIK